MFRKPLSSVPIHLSFDGSEGSEARVSESSLALLQPDDVGPPNSKSQLASSFIPPYRTAVSVSSYSIVLASSRDIGTQERETVYG